MTIIKDTPPSPKEEETKDLPVAPPEEEPDENVFDFTIMEDGSNYTLNEKLSVVSTYAATGNVGETAKQTGMSLETIHHWKRNSRWWVPVLEYVRIQRNDELDAKLTGIIEKATDIIIDRLDNGDEVVSKDGKKVRRMMSGVQVATVLGILSDKRHQLRGLDKNIANQKTHQQKVDNLFERFNDLAKKLLKEKQLNAIEGSLDDEK